MNRIDTLFTEKNSGILSIYFCAGDPVKHSPSEVIKALATGGVDMIEVGIPFSDPMADGPVIQAAATQALCGGMSLEKLFNDLEDIRQEVKIPLILMGYLNPIIHYGFERFCKRCSQVGIDGLIIPDLPYDDYISQYRETAQRYGLHIIMLITPETEEERIRLIDENTGGFIYMVSTASTTGAQKSYSAETLDYFRRIEDMGLRNPRMIGFGISNRATIEAAMSSGASGAIIGSKFVTLLEQYKTPAQALAALREALES